METIAFYANVSGVRKDRREEEGFSITYTAPTEDAAMEAAARFLRNRCNAFDLVPGCIKVGKVAINEIDAKGNYQTHNGFPFLEWKCDTSPFQFEDILYSAAARHAQSRL